MQRFRVARRVASALPVSRSFLSPFIVGLGIWIGFPTNAAYQDMTSMVAGLESGNARWRAFVEKSVAGSVHAAEMPFSDGDRITGSISGAGVELPGVGKVAFRGKKGTAATPDEDRVNRADKQGRVVGVVPVAPPKAFTAGSIFQRTSSLLRPTVEGDPRMAFAKPEIAGKEIQIAAAFHPKSVTPNPRVPGYLRDLVTNEKADILATAYAPAEPDYAKASPFAALLENEDPNAGRFIPPVGPGDHAWIETPLPASVFSAKEQQCLANAIYFEARGETSRGQAAVAQVVLNRVRNPAYPATICAVVYQNENLKNRCQFSFACDGIKDRVLSPWHYKRAKEIAMAVTAGKIFLPEVGSSTHYYAQYVSPGWARAMKKMTKIGLHIFYRTRGGGWS
ncbi:cell wall hydrolase [Arvimicrobium flavum]|uniref:cell wall hydrolase n=1 Tax=Arvimicrobium flavum TaxID=3393320 RepID=UPI00237B6F98|nr:cell wall hydrolase [Mesorhizobium shangrilense]